MHMLPPRTDPRDGWDTASPPPPSAPPAQKTPVMIHAGEALPGKQKHRLCEENATHRVWAAAPVWSNQPNYFLALKPVVSCRRTGDRICSALKEQLRKQPSNI